MQQAATTAARVVAVLSPAYLASEHGEAEREVFQAKDPSASAACCFPSGWPRSTHPGCSRHESMWTWSAGMRPAPGRHCWPPPGRAASRPRSRSTPGPSSHRSASPRRPGSRVSCRRSGTSPSIPTRTSPAATKCKARDRWQVIERPVSGQAYLTGNKVSPGYIEVRRVCHGDGGRCRYEPEPDAATPDPPPSRAWLPSALHQLAPLRGRPLSAYTFTCRLAYGFTYRSV